MGVNKVLLLGRVGKEPEIKVFEGGKSVAKISFVTDKTYTDKEGEKKTKAEWHTIVTWNQKMVNVIENFVNKGQMLFIEGEIQYKDYEKDGVKKYFTEIMLVRLEMLGKKKEEEKREKPPDVMNEDEFTA